MSIMAHGILNRYLVKIELRSAGFLFGWQNYISSLKCFHFQMRVVGVHNLG